MVDAFEGISGAACHLLELGVALINRREIVGRRHFDLAHGSRILWRRALGTLPGWGRGFEALRPLQIFSVSDRTGREVQDPSYSS